MSFKEKKYCVIKNAISKEIADFAYKYLLLKKDVAKTLFERKWIHQFEKIHGHWQDDQVPNTFSIYGDVAMETLLIKILPIMEKETGLKLIPTYAFSRIYKKGDELERHKDRPSCEISTTMNLGGDDWPIYLEPDENKGKYTAEGYTASDSTGIKVDLNPGDMLVYHGCILEHWRKPFNGDTCVQVFLHYNPKDSENNNKFDGRPHLGLPEEV